MTGNKLDVTLEFSGGAEFLFNKIKKHEVSLDGQQVKLYVENVELYVENVEFTDESYLRYINDYVTNGSLIRKLYMLQFYVLHIQKTIGDLLIWMKENILTERPELFIQDGSVRPGILVLVNDADWELMGELEYEIQPKDNILFISTLHGG